MRDRSYTVFLSIVLLGLLAITHAAISISATKQSRVESGSKAFFMTLFAVELTAAIAAVLIGFAGICMQLSKLFRESRSTPRVMGSKTTMFIFICIALYTMVTASVSINAIRRSSMTEDTQKAALFLPGVMLTISLFGIGFAIAGIVLNKRIGKGNLIFV